MAEPVRLSERIAGSLRLGRAFRLVWDCVPGLTVASYALMLVQGVLPLLTLYFTKRIVDSVAAGAGAAVKTGRLDEALFFVGCAAAASLVGVLLGSIAGLVGDAQGQYVTDHISDVLHAKSVEVDLEYYENASYYDTMQRAQAEAPYRPMRIVSGLGGLVQNLVSLVAVAALLATMHWGMAVVLVVAAAPGIVVRILFSRKTYTWQRERTQVERRAAYYHWLLVAVEHAKEIRLFGLGGLFRERFTEVRTRLRGERFKLNRQRTAADFATQLLGTAIVFSTYGYIAWRTVNGSNSIGDLVMYFQAFQRGLGALQGVLGGLAGLYEDNLFLTNVYDFLDLRPKLREPERPVPVPAPMRHGIEFDAVTFRYSGADADALQGIDLAIAPGEVVALVGENGSGKTTLVKLLCRLYDPGRGAIRIDGTDLTAFGLTELRSQISVLFQDYAHYNATVRENIWYGNVGLAASDPRIEAAAELAGAQPAIARLPRAYEAMLGKWFDEGSELSIGEWQKIALARGFVREAQVLILDEPTSAMDALAEQEVFEAVRRVIAGRTAIIISHRFSTVKMADRIVVLEKGRIVELGRHEDLVGHGGLYARMFEAQARSYR